MLNRILLVVLISIVMVSDALAEVKRLAVLEFRSGAIDSAYLLNLSDQSRRAAVEILSDEEYLIMTRENMMLILTDMGKDASCMDSSCEVEIGRSVGADVNGVLGGITTWQRVQNGTAGLNLAPSPERDTRPHYAVLEVFSDEHKDCM